MEIIVRPDLGKKAYRMRCRFRIGAFPGQDLLDRAKVHAAEEFVGDMRKQGWEYVDKFGIRMSGPYPAVDPVTLPKPHRLSSREMLPQVAQGARFRSEGPIGVMDVLSLDEQEHWEYELACVFIRSTILMEIPDLHEEER